MFNGSTLPALQQGCCLGGAAGKARKAAEADAAAGRIYPAPGYAPIAMPVHSAPFELPERKLAKIRAKAQAAAMYPMPAPPIISTLEPGVIQTTPGGLVAPAAPGVAAAEGGGILSGVSDFFSNIPTTYLYIGGAVLAFMMFKKGR